MPFEVSADQIQPLAAPRAVHAIVNGGCFVGMAAALRLRAKDYEVTVHDRCDRPGGLATVFEHEGFRHDAGRTVICALWLFEELFAFFGRKLSDRITLASLDHEAEPSARPLGRRHLEAARVLACELPEGSGRYPGRLVQARTARL
jgi:phytoene dehydrogenase-like protein